MKQIAVDSSMKKLSTEALTLQIGPAEPPLASFLLVLSFYGEGFRWAWLHSGFAYDRVTSTMG